MDGFLYEHDVKIIFSRFHQVSLHQVFSAFINIYYDIFLPGACNMNRRRGAENEFRQRFLFWLVYPIGFLILSFFLLASNSFLVCSVSVDGAEVLWRDIRPEGPVPANIGTFSLLSSFFLTPPLSFYFYSCVFMRVCVCVCPLTSIWWKKEFQSMKEYWIYLPLLVVLDRMKLLMDILLQLTDLFFLLPFSFSLPG